jgi:nitrogen fixation/metabolism regulation signal transduction histidine kinase
MKTQRFPRKKKLINPRYQLKFAFLVVFLLLFYSLIFGVAIFSPLALDFHNSPDAEDQARVAFVVLGLHKTIWPALLSVLVLAFFGAILYSHRIAGPLYHLKTALDEFMKGSFQPIRLRKTDEFKEIEPMINRLAEYLATAQSADAALHDRIKKNLKALAERLQEGPPGNTEDLKESLSALIAELDARPDAFYSAREGAVH